MPLKRALIYSPYLDIGGGGEVYSLNFAKALEPLDYRVTLAWPDPNLYSRSKKTLGLDIASFELDPRAYRLFQTTASLYQKYRHFQGYDLTFFVSDGSLPWLFSRQNYLHFQVPFTTLNPSLPNRLKLSRITEVVCNSRFTRHTIDSRLGTDSRVLYPPINTEAKAGIKKNLILAVGRFTDTLHNKRQDVLVDSFKQLVDGGLKRWQLVLIGSNREGSSYVSKLKKSAAGYPITIKTNASSLSLSGYYSKAKIFWHATGYDIDETAMPEKVEHFGISTIEAMAAGAVPVVINKGGQKEIISPAKTGYLWNTPTELQNYTLKLINQPDTWRRFHVRAQKITRQFSLDRFYREVAELIESHS